MAHLLTDIINVREIRVVLQHTLHNEMTDENSTISHLSAAMTTKEVDETQISDGNIKMTSSTGDEGFYMKFAVIVIGVVGMAGNALILYALVASKQHKKHALIVNQNALDFFSSFFLVVIYAIQLGNIYLTGSPGYWLCITLLSELPIWWTTNGSMINLAIITIDRYLKVVHAVWSRKWLRPWVVYSATAVPWFLGLVYNTATVLYTSAVINGECHSYEFFESYEINLGLLIFYISFYYFIVLALFIFCYGKILVKIRNQARVMASHNAAGSSTAQTQSHQIQSNVVKTMLLVSAFYAISWMPYNLYCLLVSAVLIPDLTYVDYGFYGTTVVAFLYTAANPFIYATKFDPVRKILKKMMPCKTAAVQPMSQT